MHWMLSPEPPGTVVLVRTDFAPPGKGSGVPKVLAGRLEELPGRGQRDMLARLKAPAEGHLGRLTEMVRTVDEVNCSKRYTPSLQGTP